MSDYRRPVDMRIVEGYRPLVTQALRGDLNNFSVGTDPDIAISLMLKHGIPLTRAGFTIQSRATATGRPEYFIGRAA